MFARLVFFVLLLLLVGVRSTPGEDRVEEEADGDYNYEEDKDASGYSDEYEDEDGGGEYEDYEYEGVYEDGEEDDEDYYEGETQVESSLLEGPLKSLVPEMISVPLSITAHVGDRMELPCSAKVCV